MPAELSPSKKIAFAACTTLLMAALVLALDLLLGNLFFADPAARTPIFSEWSPGRLRTEGAFAEYEIAARKGAHYRIFWFGGSTARGYPYMHLETPFFPNEDGSRDESSAARYLEELLERQVPERDFEVVNLGSPGADLRTEFHYMRQALAYEPDLVILQTGHNEFHPEDINYSVSRAAYRRGGVFDALLYHSFVLRSLNSGKKPFDIYAYWARPNERSLSEASYPGPELRRRILKSFSFYLEEASRLCAERGVPLLLITALSNEEWPPDQSSILRGEAAALEGEVRALIGQVRAGEWDPALERIAALEAAHPEIAELHYQKGLILKGRGEVGGARASFRRAQGLAVRPLSASPEINERIRSLGQRKDLALVDMERAYLERPEDLVPEVLIVDNQHPTPLGQYWIARQVYAALESRFVDLPSVEAELGAVLADFTAEVEPVPPRLAAQGDYFAARLHYLFSRLRGFDPLYFRQGAMAAARRAQRQDMDYFGPAFFLALLLFQEGETLEAEQHLERARALSPEQFAHAADELQNFAEAGYDLAPALRARLQDEDF